MPDSAASECPIHHCRQGFAPHRHEGMAAFWQGCRAEQPVFHDPGTGYWVVTRRADVRAVFADPETFSAANVHDPVRPFAPEVTQLLAEGGFRRDRTQANCDRPRHTRIRKASQSFLNIRQFRAQEPAIRALVAEAVNALPARGQVDLVDRLTYELPARVLFRLLGVDDVNARQIKRWADSRFMMISGTNGPEEMLDAARETLDLWNFCGALLAAREAEPGDDYASHLLAIHRDDPLAITRNEIHNLIYGVLLAGHETTTNAMGGLLQALLQDRAQWEALVADPSLIANAVEEGLRLAPPVIAWRRIATKDTRIGDVDIPKDAQILMSLASANRDEAHFGPAETLDVSRTDARDHVSFGYGIHFCLGAPLARMEIQLLIEALVAAYPDMRLADGARQDWQPTMLVRGPVQLMVDLAP